MPNVKTFRATSGSQTVYWSDGESVPSPITDQVSVSTNYSAAGLTVNESDVIWRWNGADLSQFENSPHFVSGTLSASLYVETDPHSIANAGNVLVLSSSARQGVICWLTTSSLDTNRFLVEIFISGTTTEYGGAAVLCEGSASNFHGFGALSEDGTGGASTWNVKVDSGSVDGAPSTNGSFGTIAPKLFKVDVLAHDRTVVTGSPGFTVLADVEGPRDDIVCHRFTQTLAGDNEWDSLPTGSNWEGLQLRRFGLAWRGDSAFSGGSLMKIFDMVIRKHPLDGGIRK